MSPQFRIRAGWPDGSVGEEAVIANDLAAARAEVERRGGHVFEARSRGVSVGGFRGKPRGRVKIGDFLVFNQEMIALLKAGLPVIRAFELLLERQRNPTLRRVLGEVRDRINSGASLSEAFAEQGDLFPRLYATTLKAGEKSGEIEAVLRRYLKYQRTILALARKVVSTLVYPAILMAVSLVLIALLMVVVIPRFKEFFSDFGAELPLLTVVVVDTATFLRRNIVWIGGGIVMAGLLLSRWLRTPAGQLQRDALALRLPFVGGIFQRFATSQFTRSLATLLAGGTPLVPALENAADAIANRSVAARLRDVIPKVREGGELWRALEDTGVFSDLTIEMVKVGEMSGALEEMLGSVSDFYDDEIEASLARVITFVEPAILIIMGLVIVAILGSVYLPIFSIMSQLKS
ncbi:MAG TPA: type II secretion system F family protein [Thermoanaerobaculia bacterium]